MEQEGTVHTCDDLASIVQTALFGFRIVEGNIELSLMPLRPMNLLNDKPSPSDWLTISPLQGAGGDLGASLLNSFVSPFSHSKE